MVIGSHSLGFFCSTVSYLCGLPWPNVWISQNRMLTVPSSDDGGRRGEGRTCHPSTCP